MDEYKKKKEVKHEQMLYFMVAKLRVVDCARCKGDHASLEARVFQTPLKRSGYSSRPYNFWMECPTTKEPIVFNLEVDSMEEGWVEQVEVFCCNCRDADKDIVRDCECKCHEGEDEE